MPMLNLNYRSRGCTAIDHMQPTFTPGILRSISAETLELSRFSVVDVSVITHRCLASSLTNWQTSNGPYNVEHLAGMSPDGDLLTFWWSPANDWQAVNISDITGQKIASPVTSWQTKNGPYNVEHLAGISPSGDLFAFWWSPAHDWQAVNVSDIAGQKIASPVTSWQTKNGPYNVEHLAGMNASGDLFVFWWSPCGGYLTHPPGFKVLVGRL